jgi:hypothetical protein
VPEGGADHLPDVAGLPVGELHLGDLLLLEDARALATDLANFLWALARPLATNRARLRRGFDAHGGLAAALPAGFRRFAVLIRVVEMLHNDHLVSIDTLTYWPLTKNKAVDKK